MQKRISVEVDSQHCSTCMMGHVCLPVGMPAHEVQQLDALVTGLIKLLAFTYPARSSA